MEYSDGLVPEEALQRAIADLRDRINSWGSTWVLAKARSQALHALGRYRFGADADEMLRAAGYGEIVDNRGEPYSHFLHRTPFYQYRPPGGWPDVRAD